MIPLFKVHMPQSAPGAVAQVLMSGYIGEGPKVKKFEALLQEYIGNPYGLATNSCTSAVQLALRLAGVGPGDEVISTPVTCTATNEVILAAGADIVWADVNQLTGLRFGDIDDLVTDRTKAQIYVQWGGSRKPFYGVIDVPSIVDAAHSMHGTAADYVCHSFQAIKHITTGDGGALFVRDEETYERARRLRWYGIDRDARSEFRCEDDIAEWGYKFHMNDIAAAIGIEQMRYVRGIVRQRQNQARIYDAALKDIAGCTVIPDHGSSYWLYTLHVERLADFRRMMGDKGVQVSQVHARNDKHTMFAKYRTELPGVDAFYETAICIPVGYWVTGEDQQYIIQCIREGW